METKTTLKTFFEKGDRPTQAQFAELIAGSFGCIGKLIGADMNSIADQLITMDANGIPQLIVMTNLSTGALPTVEKLVPNNSMAFNMTFQNGEVVVGQSSGKSAIILNAVIPGSPPYLIVHNATGVFTPGEKIVGQTLGGHFFILTDTFVTFDGFEDGEIWDGPGRTGNQITGGYLENYQAFVIPNSYVADNQLAVLGRAFSNTLYYSNSVPQAVACTCDIYIFGLAF